MTTNDLSTDELVRLAISLGIVSGFLEAMQVGRDELEVELKKRGALEEEDVAYGNPDDFAFGRI